MFNDLTLQLAVVLFVTWMAVISVRTYPAEAAGNRGRWALCTLIFAVASLVCLAKVGMLPGAHAG